MPQPLELEFQACAWWQLFIAYCFLLLLTALLQPFKRTEQSCTWELHLNSVYNSDKVPESQGSHECRGRYCVAWTPDKIPWCEGLILQNERTLQPHFHVKPLPPTEALIKWGKGKGRLYPSFCSLKGKAGGSYQDSQAASCLSAGQTRLAVKAKTWVINTTCRV